MTDRLVERLVVEMKHLAIMLEDVPPGMSPVDEFPCKIKRSFAAIQRDDASNCRRTK
jgi:hypothetical protein